MTRARDIADVQDNLGGAVAPFVAGKNFVINGGFDVWQRGTTFASPSNAYTADRFAATPSAAISYTVSQQPSFMTTSRYCLRMQRNSGQTSTAALFLGMAFETFDVIRMQGKTMTWSFYLKAGSNFSPAGAVLGVQLNSGTGTDQGPFSLHTGEVNLVSQSPVITTTGTRFSYTFTVPTNATSMRWNIATTPVGTAGTNDFYEIADMQLEIGSQATPFARAGGSIGGELALCQRYYWRTTSNATAATVIGQVAIAASTTVLSLPMKCPVTMRVAPTSVDFSSLAVLDPTVSRVNVTAVALDNPSTDIASVSLTSSGLTAQRTYVLYNQSAATGFIGFSAEL
jgi:hypothetical protein